MEVRSNCRCCSAGCGIIADVVDGRLVSVGGDAEHPLSRGNLCLKGHALPWSQHRSDRLDHPMINGAVNAADLARLDIRDGDLVRVVGEDGEVLIEARTDPTVPLGAVWIPHGWFDHNVSNVCSLSRCVDPLTGQPAMTGLPIRLEKRTPESSSADARRGRSPQCIVGSDTLDVGTSQ
jgi:anaerobic selenocysteine-containing dehydrogenase